MWKPRDHFLRQSVFTSRRNYLTDLLHLYMSSWKKHEVLRLNKFEIFLIKVIYLFQQKLSNLVMHYLWTTVKYLPANRLNFNKSKGQIKWFFYYIDFNPLQMSSNFLQKKLTCSFKYIDYFSFVFHLNQETTNSVSFVAWFQCQWWSQ